MLTHSEVGTYLRGQGLLDADAVVAGDLEILDSTRGNVCYEVVSARAPSYLLKQGPDAERAARIAYEAAMYAWLHTTPQARRVRSYLPAMHRYDPQEQVLVLELLPQALTWGAYHQRRGRFPLRIAALLGAAVGTLHQIGPGAVSGDGASGAMEPRRTHRRESSLRPARRPAVAGKSPAARTQDARIPGRGGSMKRALIITACIALAGCAGMSSRPAAAPAAGAPSR